MAKTIITNESEVATTLVEGATIELEAGVFKVDKDGNGLNDKNEVIKTKAELTELLKQTIVTTDPIDPPLTEAVLIEGTVIDLDGSKFTIDKTGAAVDEHGKVFKTKDELIALIAAQKSGGTEEEVNYIESIQKVTNLIPTTKEGGQIIYENTVEGLTQYATDLHRTGIELGKEEFRQELLEEYPALPEILNHLKVHGTLKNYNAEPDYSKVTISDTDESQWLSIYITGQLKKGLSEEEARVTANYLKTDGKLKDAAVANLTYLNTAQTKAKAELTEAANARQQAQDAADAAFWKTVDTTLTNRKMVVGGNTYTIPEVIQVKEADGKIVAKSHKEFTKYIKEQRPFVVEGQRVLMTQFEYDSFEKNNKRTVDDEIFDAYRMFTKYDDSQLVQTQIKDQVVKNVLKIVTKAGGKTTPTDGPIKLKLAVK
jgi:hypothetical protein